jgi:hypothetical protein
MLDFQILTSRMKCCKYQLEILQLLASQNKFLAQERQASYNPSHPSATEYQQMKETLLLKAINLTTYSTSSQVMMTFHYSV